MATALPVLVSLLCVTLIPIVSADNDCKPYIDIDLKYHSTKICRTQFCCGNCNNRYCCSNFFFRFDEDEQDNCPSRSFEEPFSTVAIASLIGSIIVVILIFICCCVCPCCCLYKMCRKPRPVATTTHTVINTLYPRQPTASSSQAYQGVQYPSYQPVLVQQGYGGQPMQQGYGGQPIQQGYGGQPMQQGYGAQPMQQGHGGQPTPTAPYQGQPSMPGPPPPYQEAAGPGNAPAPMPYSQAAFTPGQTPYPLQPPAQPGQLPPQPDLHATQPAYNPAYVEPPQPKTGY